MSDATTKPNTNIFEDDDMPEFPEVAYDANEELPAEALITAVAFASLLWERLTIDEKAQLSTWERAALERLAEISDEVGLEEIGEKLRTN
jgi:hypothetical protein